MEWLCIPCVCIKLVIKIYRKFVLWQLESIMWRKVCILPVIYKNLSKYNKILDMTETIPIMIYIYEYKYARPSDYKFAWTFSICISRPFCVACVRVRVRMCVGVRICVGVYRGCVWEISIYTRMRLYGDRLIDRHTTLCIYNGSWNCQDEFCGNCFEWIRWTVANVIIWRTVL